MTFTLATEIHTMTTHTTESLASQDTDLDNYHYELQEGDRYVLTPGELEWLRFVDGRYMIADHIRANLDGDLLTIDPDGMGQAMADDDSFPKIVMLSEDSALHRIAFYSAIEPDTH
jgi:hypothetical protein